jgi:hypothetical protein
MLWILMIVLIDKMFQIFFNFRLPYLDVLFVLLSFLEQLTVGLDLGFGSVRLLVRAHVEQFQEMKSLYDVEMPTVNKQ